MPRTHPAGGGKQTFRQEPQRQEFSEDGETKLDRGITRAIEHLHDRYFQTGRRVVSKDQQGQGHERACFFANLPCKTR